LLAPAAIRVSVGGHSPGWSAYEDSVAAYWIGLRPGDVHLNLSSPGWAKHAWSCFFAPWIAEATVLAARTRCWINWCAVA